MSEYENGGRLTQIVNVAGLDNLTNPASQQTAPIPDRWALFRSSAERNRHTLMFSGNDILGLLGYIAVLEAASVRAREALADIDRAYESSNTDEDLGLSVRCGLERRRAALTAMRDFMWSEGYADQTAVMRQADAALGTPTTKEFMQKVCSDAYEGTPGREKP